MVLITRTAIINTLADKYSNIHRIPQVEKVVLNMHLGKASAEQMKLAYKILSAVTNQTPAKTITKKNLGSWGLRRNVHSGYKVTLRRDAAYNFLQKFVLYSLTKIRNFKGFKHSVLTDRAANLGIDGCDIFFECRDLSWGSLGMNITIVSSNDNGRDLFEAIKIPLQ